MQPKLSKNYCIYNINHQYIEIFIEIGSILPMNRNTEKSFHIRKNYFYSLWITI